MAWMLLLMPATAGFSPAHGAPPEARARRGPPPPPFEEMFRSPLVYSVPGMDKVEVREDVVYKTMETPEGRLALKMDVYLPRDASKERRRPLVLFMSGGSVDDPDWRKAGIYTSYGRLAAASGFVGVTYQKRYGRGLDGIRTGNADTKDLVRFLREHAAEYGIDPERIAEWGFSGGGMMLGPALRERPAYVRALLYFYAASGAPAMYPEDVGRAIRDEGFSSIENIEGEGPLPALFVARAAYDNPELNDGLDALVQAALDHDALIDVMNHPTGRHGFDLLDNDARSREIVERAVAFLKAHLAEAP